VVRNSRTPRATDAAENPLIARLRRFMELTPEETDALLGLQQHRVRFPAHAEIVAHGQKYAACYIVQEGWGCRYKLLPNGRRQVLDFVLPGDFIGLHSTLMGGASHAVEAITNLIAAQFPARLISEVSQRHPRLNLAAAWCEAREAAIMRERVVSVGRRDAYQRLTHLFLELHQRLSAINGAGASSFDLPVTQEQLGDALGLSAVHVNRTLRRLRSNGIIRFDSKPRRISLLNPSKAVETSDFDDRYLKQARIA
jgi:CRP-like cAMP-binding protein